MSRTRTVVLADGCFDPFHVGHLRYLEYAAKLGSRLVVNVAPDAAIRAKGRKPFQSLLERAEMIKALSCVYGTCSGALERIIYELRPHVLVKGTEWSQRLPASVMDACYQSNTRLIFAETQERTSTERLA